MGDTVTDATMAAVADDGLDAAKDASTWRTFDTVEDAQGYADDCWAKMLAATDDGRIRVTFDDGQASLVLLGSDDEGKTVHDGITTAWAEPRQTAKGRWAVQCPPFDKGDTEPVWPGPVPLP